MQDHTTHQTLSPEEPGTPAPILPESDTSGAAASNADAGPENQAASDAPNSPESPATTPVTKVDGIPEWVRTTSGELKSIQFRYCLPPNEASLFEKNRARAEYKRDPWERMPVPTNCAAYGTTEELFPGSNWPWLNKPIFQLRTARCSRYGSSRLGSRMCFP